MRSRRKMMAMRVSAVMITHCTQRVRVQSAEVYFTDKSDLIAITGRYDVW